MENQSPASIPAITEPEPISQPIPEKTLYSWRAPARLFKRRSREFYTTVGALVLLLSIILVFAKEFLLIGVILAMGFVAYVLASVSPDEITHALTNKGIRTGDKLYPWETLGRYWWQEKWHQSYINIESPGRIPSNLILLLGEGNKEDIDHVVKTYLIMEKPLPTWFDKAAIWIQEKVPLESE
jgi:hypothetical protein